jgi:hypothetical protein
MTIIDVGSLRFWWSMFKLLCWSVDIPNVTSLSMSRIVLFAYMM